MSATEEEEEEEQDAAVPMGCLALTCLGCSLQYWLTSVAVDAATVVYLTARDWVPPGGRAVSASIHNIH